MDQVDIEQKKQRKSDLNKAAAAARKQVEDMLVAGYPPAASAVGQEVQFFHDKFHARTYAIVAPTGDELRGATMKLLGGGKEVAVLLQVGISQVNLDEGDQYNKRIGRCVSSSKLSTISMKLRAANVYENIQHYTLELGKTMIQFSIQKNPNVPYVTYVQELGLRQAKKK